MQKLKIIIVCLVAAGALVMDFVQQQTIKQLRQENDVLKQQAAQVSALQDQLNSASQAASTAAASSDQQSLELARLRASAAEARSESNELLKARQQIDSLNQRLASESEARQGAVAAYQQVEAQAQQATVQRAQASHADACINNLRLIDAAKQQWALEFKKQVTDVPTADDLRPYFGRGTKGELPVCPDGGTYIFGAVSEKPTCSIAGHALP